MGHYFQKCLACFPLVISIGYHRKNEKKMSIFVSCNSLGCGHYENQAHLGIVSYIITIVGFWGPTAPDLPLLNNSYEDAHPSTFPKFATIVVVLSCLLEVVAFLYCEC
jgi:hypothetical protein